MLISPVWARGIILDLSLHLYPNIESLSYKGQAHSQEPGLQYHMGLKAGYPDIVACEQQKPQTSLHIRKSDQHVCYKLSEM